MASGFVVWGRVLGINAAVVMVWIIFYDITINILLEDYIVPLVNAGTVPNWFEDRFKMFYYFWPVAIMLATVIWGILTSTQKDYYEYRRAY